MKNLVFSSSVLLQSFEASNCFSCSQSKRKKKKERLFILSPHCVKLFLCVCSWLVPRPLRIWRRFILILGSNGTSIQRRKELSANFRILQKRHLDTTLRILAMELKLKLLLQLRSGAGTCEFSLFSMPFPWQTVCYPFSSILHIYHIIYSIYNNIMWFSCSAPLAPPTPGARAEGN